MSDQKLLATTLIAGLVFCVVVIVVGSLKPCKDKPFDGGRCAYQVTVENGRMWCRCEDSK